MREPFVEEFSCRTALSEWLTCLRLHGIFEGGGEEEEEEEAEAGQWDSGPDLS